MENMKSPADLPAFPPSRNSPSRSLPLSRIRAKPLQMKTGGARRHLPSIQRRSALTRWHHYLMQTGETDLMCPQCAVAEAASVAATVRW